MLYSRRQMNQDDLIQRAYARLDAKIEAKPPAKKPSFIAELWASRNRLPSENRMIVNIIILPFTYVVVAFMGLWAVCVWFPSAFLVCFPYLCIMDSIGRTKITKTEEWLLDYVFGWSFFEASFNNELYPPRSKQTRR